MRTDAPRRVTYDQHLADTRSCLLVFSRFVKEADVNEMFSAKCCLLTWQNKLKFNAANPMRFAT